MVKNLVKNYRTENRRMLT